MILPGAMPKPKAPAREMKILVREWIHTPATNPINMAALRLAMPRLI